MICATAIYCAHNWPGRYTFPGESRRLIDGMTGRIYRVFDNGLTTRDPVAEALYEKKLSAMSDAELDAELARTAKKPWEEYQSSESFDPDAYLATPTNKSVKQIIDDPFKIPEKRK